VFIEGATQDTENTGGTEGGSAEEITSIDLAGLETVEHHDLPMDEREPVLVCSDVTKRFGGVQALSHVDLEVRPGEIVGLIGQNGAGKTTLMDCISGFHTTDSGRIIFRNTDVTAWTPSQRARGRLGRTFQEARLFPSLTVTEVIAVACERTVANRSLVADATHQPASYIAEGMTAEKVAGLVEMLGLSPYANTPVSSLSTGTRRIAELACLLAEEPVLMCLDEPSAGVAQRETEALGQLLRHVCEHTGAAMLVIEHDMPLLAGLCDRLVAMELGQIMVQGRPEEVLDHPAVIAAYLGTDAATINRSGATLGVPDVASHQLI
jgi:ABC-type branched-subunit amino acid transport system ATPase component